MSAEESRLWLRAIQGEREAFESLISDLVPRVRGLLVRLGGFRSDLDDLTQEVFVRVIDGLRTLQNPKIGRSWVFGITVNVSREATRARSRRAEPLENEPSHDPRIPDHAHACDLSDRVSRAVAELPGSIREPLVLSVYEKLTGPEIAASLGLSQEAVRNRLFRAREILKKSLASAATEVTPGRSQKADR